MADQGTDAMEREKSFLFASKEGRYLYRVEEALRRLYAEPDEFGLCHSCKKPIPFARLEALPHARYCLDCKMREEQAA
jgi:RNA polymerase-binding transcription factor DksA